MANEYLYGAYGHIGTSVARSAVQSGTVPIYVGTAPINLLRGAEEVTNTPIQLSGMVDAQRKLGYSSNWDNFTLCEAMSAHFNNSIGNVGPIYVINVLDLDVHIKDTKTTRELSFVRGRAEILSDTIIIDSLEIGNLVEGEEEDYTLSYDFNKGKLTIKLVDSNLVTGSINAEFYEIDRTKITAEDIIGGENNGVCTGLAAIKLLYQAHNAVANIIAAPGWSHYPAVYNAMISASQKINGHWDAFVVADIPLMDSEENKSIETMDDAIKWQNKHQYKSERSKVYWPMAVGNTGDNYHLSSLAVATMQRVDFENSSVPKETPGNKPVAIKKLFFGSDSRNQGYDQQEARTLTKVGISTAVYWGGRWVLWGDHTAAYTYGGEFDPRGIFDVNIRMLMHITNSFQREWGTSIDKPMSLQLKDTIMIREQEKLDVLVATGALIGTPKIYFLELENPVTDLMNGDFRWDIMVTPTPPLKSATVYVTYTDEGFQAYFGGES